MLCSNNPKSSSNTGRLQHRVFWDITGCSTTNNEVKSFQMHSPRTLKSETNNRRQVWKEKQVCESNADNIWMFLLRFTSHQQCLHALCPVTDKLPNCTGFALILSSFMVHTNNLVINHSQCSHCTRNRNYMRKRKIQYF